MTEVELVAKLAAFAREIQARLDAGWTLRDVSRWSYVGRASGAAPVYMAINTVDDRDRKTVVEVSAAPTRSQHDLYKFFDERAPGSALPRFRLRASSGGVSFTERLGRGRDNLRDLLRLRERDMTVEEKAEIEKGVYGGAEWCSAWRRTWLAVAVQCVLAGAEGHY